MAASAERGLGVDMGDAAAGSERALRGSGVAVVLGQEASRPAPCCPHGESGGSAVLSPASGTDPGRGAEGGMSGEGKERWG